MPKNTTLHFLLVDDDHIFSKYFAEWLEELGPYTVDVAASPEEAQDKVEGHPYDGVIIDYALAAPLDGMVLLKQFKKEHPDLPVVMMTGMDRSIGREALREGAFWYLEKPIDYTEAEVVFRYLGERKRLIQDFQRLWRKKGKKVKRGETPKQRTQQADEEARASAALAALSQALLSAPTVEDLLRIVTQKAPAFLSADAVAVGLIDLTTGQLDSEQGTKELQLPSGITSQSVTQGLLEGLWANKGQGNPTWWYTEPQGGKRWQAHLCFAPRPQPFGSPDTAETTQDTAAPQPLAVVWAVGKEPSSEEERLRFESGVPVVARLLGAAIAQHRQRALFKAVGEAAEKLLAARTRGAVYDAVRTALEEAFEAGTYYLAEYDAITDTISFPLFVDLKEHKEAPSPRHASSKEKSGATGYIIRSGQAWPCLRWGADDPCSPMPDGASIQVRKPLPRVFLGVPIVAQGETLGVLSVQRYAPIPFGQGLQEALTTLAALIGLALTRRRQEEAHRAFLESVFEKPLRDVLVEIAGRVKRALHADIVTLHVYDAQREVFLPDRARLGLSDEEATKPYCGTENEALERLLKWPQKEHFAPDASRDPIFQGDFVRKHNVHSSGGVVLTLTQDGEPQPVGVLVVNYIKDRHRFITQEKKLLRDLGQEAAMAVGVALMAARERQARERWQLHGKIAQAIRSVLQESQGGADAARQQKLEERLAEEVTRLLKEKWPSPGCGEVTPSILYADYGKHHLRFPESVWEIYRQGNSTTPQREIPFGEGICGWVAEHKQSYYAHDTGKDEHYLSMRPDTRSEIGVPILLGDRLLGVLDVEATLPRFFEEEDRVFLERVAQDLATALGAWGDQQRAQKILEVTASIPNQPERGLEMLVKTAFDLVNNPPDAVSAVSLFSKDEDALKLAALYPPPQARRAQSQKQPCCQQRFPLETPSGKRRGIVVRAAIKRRTVAVPDVTQDPDYVPCHEDTKAEMAVPVLWPMGEVAGVFNVEYRDPTAMDFYDQQVLESLASQMAVALMLREQARTLQQEARQRRLAAALAALGIAAADYGHQWKNELAAFRGTLGLLEEETLPFCKKLKERKGGMTLRLAHRLGVVPDLEKICRWLDRIQALFSEQRPAFPPPDEDLESIAVGPWLEGIVTRWQQRLEKTGSRVTLQLEGVPGKAVVRANRLWLTRAVDNLLSNAARAAAQAAEKEGRNPRVTLTSNATEGWVFLKIADNGTGIPEKVRPYLFDDRVPAEAAPQGHGTGALITAFVAQFYGGTVQIERTTPEGTTIVLTLPRTQKEKAP